MAGFRSTDHGKFAAEWAMFKAALLKGNSRINDGGTGDYDGGGTSPPNITTLSLYQVAGAVSGIFCQRAVTRFIPTRLIASLGASPVLLSAKWAFLSSTYATTCTVRLYRMPPEVGVILDWDYAGGDPTEISYRYKDRSAATKWYLDCYAPYPGQDVDPTYFDTQTWAQPSGVPPPPSTPPHVRFDILTVLQEALSSNLPMYVEFFSPSNSLTAHPYLTWNANGANPYFELKYVFPFEIYHCTPGGVIDLSQLAGISGTDRFYLGSYERGETGAAVKMAIKNWSDKTIPHIEIPANCHAEWTTPIQIAGAGTGTLDYPSPLDNAVSQRYIVKFSNATDFVVLGYAHGNNPDDLNTNEAAPTWQGDINTIFTAPSGGLKLLPAGWQTGFALADEWEFYVTGNTVDPSWPTDSAEQIQFTEDNAGVPLVTGWRPSNGRRIRSTASVTIDAATKRIPTLAIESTLWIVDTPAFIADATNIDRGTVAAAGESEIGAPTHNGIDLNDLTLHGNYNGTAFYKAADNNEVVLRIHTQGAQDKYEISWDGGDDHGATWDDNGGLGYECLITEDPLPTQPSIRVKFGAITGHTAFVAAQGTVTIADPFAGGGPAAGETMVIGANTYTWRAALAAPFDVLIGGTPAACATNLAAAITLDATDVTASVPGGALNTVVVTAVKKGVVGDALTFTEAATDVTMNGGGNLGGTTAGVDGDLWWWNVQPFYVQLQGLAVTSNVYAAGVRVSTMLPIRDLIAAIRGRTSAESAAAQVNVYIDSPAALGFLNGQVVFIQSIDDTDVNEEATILNVATDHIEMVGVLVGTYPVDSYIVVRDSGVKYAWQRVVASLTSALEMKTVRLCTRT